MKIKIRKSKSTDLDWVKSIFIQRWGSDFVVSRGKIHRPEALDGFIAEINSKKVGLVTFKISGKQLEITTFDSLLKKKGIGSALLKKIIDFAKRKSIKRISLITTNDNLEALKFWQKRGFCLSKIYPLAIDKITRKIKPQIPRIGAFGVPIRDEIELEIRL